MVITVSPLLPLPLQSAKGLTSPATMPPLLMLTAEHVAPCADMAASRLVTLE